MKYKYGKTTDKIKPYSRARCRMTDANCAINVDKQAEMYNEWMDKNQRCTVHLFPNRHPQSHAQQVRDHFMGVYPVGRFVIRDVDPKDWE